MFEFKILFSIFMRSVRVLSSKEVESSDSIDMHKFNEAKDYFDKNPTAIKFSKHISNSSSFVRDPHTGVILEIIKNQQFQSQEGGFGRVKKCIDKTKQYFAVKIQEINFADEKERLRIQREFHISADQGFAKMFFLKMPLKIVFKYLDPSLASVGLGYISNVPEDYLFIRREINSTNSEEEILESLEKDIDNFFLKASIQAIYLCLRHTDTLEEKLFCYSRDGSSIEIKNWDQYNPNIIEMHLERDHILSDKELELFHKYKLFPYIGKAYQIHPFYDRTLDEHITKMRKQKGYGPMQYRAHCLDVAIQLLIQVYQLHQGISSKTGKKIVHCDIKPNNLMFDKKDQLRLIDFGLSMEITNKNIEDNIVGTAHYCPFDDYSWKEWDYIELDFLAALRSIFYPSAISQVGWAHKSKKAWVTISGINSLIDADMFRCFPPFIQELLDTKKLSHRNFITQKVSVIFVAAALIMYKNDSCCTKEDIELLKSKPDEQISLIKQYKENSDDAISKIETISQLLISYQQKLQGELQEIICLKNKEKNPRKNEELIGEIHKKLLVISQLKKILDNPYKTVFDKCLELQSSLTKKDIQLLNKHRYGFFGQTTGAKVIEKIKIILDDFTLKNFFGVSLSPARN